MVIGCGGSGKSTFSQALHRVTAIELIHLDKHFWHPNWVEPETDAWEKIVTDLSIRDEWIMDGNYGGTMDIRLDRADTVVFLDRSSWLCLFRVLKRLWKHRGMTRSDMGADCKERFSWEFLRYILSYNKTRRSGILEKLEGLDASKEVVILQNEWAIRNYLASVESELLNA